LPALFDVLYIFSINPTLNHAILMFSDEAPQLQLAKGAKNGMDKKRKGEPTADKVSPASKKLKAMGMLFFPYHHGINVIKGRFLHCRKFGIVETKRFSVAITLEIYLFQGS
jgi:hypothetical protein